MQSSIHAQLAMRYVIQKSNALVENSYSYETTGLGNLHFGRYQTNSAWTDTSGPFY